MSESSTTTPPPPPPRYRFGAGARLHGSRAFALVYGAKVRKSLGPLAVWARPNGLPQRRLGLSVGRAVGTAVVRHRIKRLVREAFRLSQHDEPAGYDVVVVVYRHAPLPLADYQRLLRQGITAVDAVWRKRI